MHKTMVIVFGTVLGATLLSGCKKEEETAPDAGSAVVPTPPVDPALAVDAAAPAIPQPATPTPLSPTPVTTPKTDAGAVATDAGSSAATDAGAAADAGTKTDAGTVTVSNCRANCLAQLASCMTPQPGKNGGAPVFADANKCKAASDSCQAACK